jgi:hypothetical protein
MASDTASTQAQRVIASRAAATPSTPWARRGMRLCCEDQPEPAMPLVAEAEPEARGKVEVGAGSEPEAEVELEAGIEPEVEAETIAGTVEDAASAAGVEATSANGSRSGSIARSVAIASRSPRATARA